MKKTILVAIFVALGTVGTTLPAQAGNVRGGVYVDLGILFPFNNYSYNDNYYRPARGYYRGPRGYYGPRPGYRHGYRDYRSNKRAYRRGYQDGRHDSRGRRHGRGHGNGNRWH